MMEYRQLDLRIAKHRGEYVGQEMEMLVSWEWPDFPGSKQYDTKPQPYSTEWWAAASLLEELQGEDIPNPKYSDEWGVCKRDGEYRCGPVHHLEGFSKGAGVGDTAPLAIARAYIQAICT